MAAGRSVELVLDVNISGVQAGVPLGWEIQSGANGSSVIKLYHFVKDAPVEISSTYLKGMLLDYKVPSEKVTGP